jgi:predicted nucleic acid-binding protein
MTVGRVSGLLLDTDVIVELRSPHPDAAVTDFLRRRRHQRIFVSALTIGELHLVSRTDTQYQHMAEWVQDFVDRYGPNILPVDAAVAARWGPMLTDGEMSAVDSLIAATAAQKNLSVVSRNVEIYRRFAVPAINPWIAEIPPGAPLPSLTQTTP